MTEKATPGVLAVQLLTPEEVAAEIRMSSWWVRQQVRDGRVSCVRMGRRIFFTRQQLAELVDARVRPASVVPAAPVPASAEQTGIAQLRQAAAAMNRVRRSG